MSESLIKKKYLQYIDEIIKNKKVSHAYLIEVDNYDQDLVYVLDFIKMIICNLSYGELQNTSNKIINLIDNNNYPDIRIISSDTSIIKKSQMIDLQREYSNKSLYSDKRFYIIKETENYNIVCQMPKKAIVHADKSKINQVVYNLINNAINYTGDDKTVTIRLTTTFRGEI